MNSGNFAESGKIMKPDKNVDKKLNSIFLISLGYSYGVTFDKSSCYVQLGLLYLGTVLKQKGYKVSLLYSDYPDVEEIIEQIKSRHVAIAGFYTTTENIYRSLKCAGMLKERFPDLIIMMGGPHASVMDKHILETYNHIDIIARGEGENTVIQLAEYYFEGKNAPEHIKGISYRKNNEFCQNSDSPFIDSLDNLPVPDRDLLEEPLRSFDIKFPRIITGRGCPFKCTFCYEGFLGSSYRMRSAEHVLEEVKYLYKRGDISYLRFLDDTFTVNPQRTMKICKGLRDMSEEGTKFVWFAEGRVDVLSRYPRLLYAMSLAGLAVLQIGVECAEQQVLDMYQKNITLEEIEEVVRTCNSALIPSVSINFIIGGPLESRDLYRKNLDFVRKLMKLAPGRLNITSTLLVPFPGTKIMNEPEQFGLNITDNECITGMTNDTCFCENEALNCCEITGIKRDFDREVWKIMAELSRYVPYDMISQNFSLKSSGIETPWAALFSDDTGVRRFYNLKLHKINISFSEAEEDKILNYYPSRTYPLFYNEDNSIVLHKVYGKEILDDTGSRLYELSSGKRTFSEILHIAEEKIFTDRDSSSVYEEVKKFYRLMEKFCAVIFLKI